MTDEKKPLEDWHTIPEGYRQFDRKYPEGSVLPLPDVVDPGDKPWEILPTPGTGHTDITAREMHVPVDNSAKSKQTKLHEMLHVGFSRPAEVVLAENPDILPKYIKIIEDVRLAEIQGRLHYPHEYFTMKERKEVAENIANMTNLADQIAMTMLCWHDPKLRSKVRKELKKANEHTPGRFVQLSSYTRSYLRLFTLSLEKFPPEELMLAVAKALTKLSKQEDEARKKEAASRYAASCLTGGGKGEDGDEQDGDAGALIRGGFEYPMLSPPERNFVDFISREFARGHIPPIIDADWQTWGTLEIQDIPLTRPVSPHKSPRRRFSQDEGTIPERPYNECSSGRIFTSKRRVLGGSVLLDCSGSMQLDEKDVIRLVELAPALWIAGYGGFENHGEMIVYVRNGMMVERVVAAGGGNNVVDGPALLELAKQQEPRLWISDGGVTGIGDGCSYESLRREAAAICHQYRISRARNIEDALAYLLGRVEAKKKVA